MPKKKFEKLFNYAKKPSIFFFFINYCHHLKKRVEIQSKSKIFIFLINSFNIFNISLTIT